MANVREFCATAIPQGLSEGAYGAESLLWIKVTHDIAKYMKANPLETEQLVRAWMRGWKTLSNSSAVTVTVEWGSVEVAKGQTRFSGDQVTIR